MKKHILGIAIAALIAIITVIGIYSSSNNRSRSTDNNSKSTVRPTSTYSYGSGSSYSGGNHSGSSGSSSKKGPWHSSNVKNDGTGNAPYPCYGKHNTCSGKTYNYRDLYCDSCDPDGDNIEG